MQAVLCRRGRLYREMEIVANVFDLYSKLDGFVEDPEEPSLTLTPRLMHPDIA
ncbi:MAG: hypothetical protein ACKN9T_16645 [Candidatus Methylumidiphilus sp.]